MKDLQDDVAVSRLTKLNPVMTYDLKELESLVHEYEVHFLTKCYTKSVL